MSAESRKMFRAAYDDLKLDDPYLLNLIDTGSKQSIFLYLLRCTGEQGGRAALSQVMTMQNR